MPTANLSSQSQIDTSNDSIVIVNLIEDLPGGRTLDATGVSTETINAGHVIIEETSSGDLKPAPVTGGVYDALPAGHAYKGVLAGTILTAKPIASILVRGTVNQAAAVAVAELPAYLAAAKTALPLIRFVQD